MYDFCQPLKTALNRTSGIAHSYAFFLAAFLGAAASVATVTVFVAALAGLLLPNEPAKIFPFFVLISPRPIIFFFIFIE
jgi:hypothetical protein